MTSPGFSAFFLEDWLLIIYWHATAALKILKDLEGDDGQDSNLQVKMENGSASLEVPLQWGRTGLWRINKSWMHRERRKKAFSNSHGPWEAVNGQWGRHLDVREQTQGCWWVGEGEGVECLTCPSSELGLYSGCHEEVLEISQQGLPGSTPTAVVYFSCRLRCICFSEVCA